MESASSSNDLNGDSVRFQRWISRISEGKWREFRGTPNMVNIGQGQNLLELVENMIDARMNHFNQMMCGWRELQNGLTSMNVGWIYSEMMTSMDTLHQFELQNFSRSNSWTCPQRREYFPPYLSDAPVRDGEMTLADSDKPDVLTMMFGDFVPVRLRNMHAPASSAEPSIFLQPTNNPTQGQCSGVGFTFNTQIKWETTINTFTGSEPMFTSADYQGNVQPDYKNAGNGSLSVAETESYSSRKPPTYAEIVNKHRNTADIEKTTSKTLKSDTEDKCVEHEAEKDKEDKIGWIVVKNKRRESQVVVDDVRPQEGQIQKIQKVCDVERVVETVSGVNDDTNDTHDKDDADEKRREKRRLQRQNQRARKREMKRNHYSEPHETDTSDNSSMSLESPDISKLKATTSSNETNEPAPIFNASGIQKLRDDDIIREEVEANENDSDGETSTTGEATESTFRNAKEHAKMVFRLLWFDNKKKINQLHCDTATKIRLQSLLDMIRIMKERVDMAGRMIVYRVGRPQISNQVEENIVKVARNLIDVTRHTVDDDMTMAKTVCQLVGRITKNLIYMHYVFSILILPEDFFPKLSDDDPRLKGYKEIIILTNLHMKRVEKTYEQISDLYEFQIEKVVKPYRLRNN